MIVKRIPKRSVGNRISNVFSLCLREEDLKSIEQDLPINPPKIDFAMWQCVQNSLGSGLDYELVKDKLRPFSVRYQGSQIYNSLPE